MTSAIVLVDDEKVILDSLKSQLASFFRDQFVYETAESVEEGWEVLEALEAEGLRVVVVVSDWLMPGKKGDEFLGEVRTRFPRIGRILLTGHADQEAIERARATSAAQDILFKPWRADQLRRAVEQAIQRGR